nr:response regulator [Gammaproteobacteria bacterium]
QIILRSRKIAFIIVAALVLMSIISFLIYFLNLKGAFKKEPKVEITPNNTYSETLHVVTDKSYEPFSYILDDGSYSGFDVELIAEIANRLHMNLDLKLLDWEDAQQKLLNGGADLILNMEVSVVEENDNLIGTIPTAEKQYVVYGYDSVDYLGELYGKRIGSMQMFSELGLDITYVSSYDEMFSKLKSKEFDYVICPIQVANSFLNKMDSKGIISSYPISYMYGCIALKDEDTLLRDKVNDIIEELHNEGFIDKLDKKWIVERYEDVTLVSVIKNQPIVVVIIFITLLAISVLSVYIISIGKRVRIEKSHLEEIKGQNEKLEIASSAKTTFLFNMSHDIRTPMNAIIGFTNLASKHLDDKEALKDYLSKIEISSNHLLGLINDVLEMSRIESGKVELELKPLDVNEAIKTIETIMKDLASKKKQELIIERVNINHPFIIADHLRCDRIFLNLLSNAIKFTPENGHILFKVEETGSSDDKVDFNFVVKDDGIGMSEEFQKNVFEAFEREKTSTISKTEGTGLGMSITKRLVDLMGGDISLKSKVGEGTEFTVYLSFDIAEKIEEKEETIVDKQHTGEHKILVVDDNEINREIINAILEDLGYVAILKEDGEAALNFVKSSKPGDFDLILMDIQMPKLDGYETTRAIRNLDSELKDIPIVALTANAFEEDKKNAKEAGMNDHLAKPINIEELIKVLNKLL